jgi:protein-S-isoprenylcysteine O-methyltransferase Ste14
MSLRNQLEKSGSWLFRWRSYLPLALLPMFVVCFASFTYLGGSDAESDIWQLLCMVVSFSGLAVRVLTVGRAPRDTSGRNTKTQLAASLSTTGMYSVTRHPLYLGNYLVMLGFCLSFHTWWLALLVTTIYALYYERIMLAEEAFLRERFGEQFEQWAAVTPAFIPNPRLWNAPAMPFCWRTVLQREYNAFFLIVTFFFLFDCIADSVVERHLTVNWVWFGLFLGGFLVFAVLRTLKKRTTLLNVAGR